MLISRCIATISIILMCCIASADSLWTPEAKSMFSDKKAKEVGDIVTILITESSTSSQKTSSEFSKDLKHANDAGIGPILKLLPEFQVSSKQSGGSEGTNQQSTRLTARLTAKVVKVLPNGNLMLEGTRTVEANHEKQEIKLTGVVRQEDISPDNTVLSTYLADAVINCTGKGPIGDRQKEGIISKLIKFLF